MGPKNDPVHCVLSISGHVAMGLLWLQSCNNVSGTPSAVSLPLFLHCHGCAVAPVHMYSLLTIHLESRCCCHPHGPMWHSGSQDISCA